MPKKIKAQPKKIRELKAKDIEYAIGWKPTGVTTSDDIKPCHGIIGQQRAVDAIKTGLNVKSDGYNIFVTGLVGTGRTTTIKHLLEQLDHKTPDLLDICYVNNFKNEDCPCVLTFKAGDGRRFKKDMSYLINSVRKAVPKIFLSDDYKDKQSRITREFDNRQKELIRGFEEKLNEAGFVMVQVQSGMGVHRHRWTSSSIWPATESSRSHGLMNCAGCGTGCDESLMSPRPSPRNSPANWKWPLKNSIIAPSRLW
jgi:hypothetical protein